MKQLMQPGRHAGAKRFGAAALAVILTVVLTTAAFAASPGSSGSGAMVREGTATGTAAQFMQTVQVRESTEQSLLRLGTRARLRQAIQNRQVASDLEELRQARQQLIDSGDWDAFKAALETQLQTLHALRADTAALWEELAELNAQIRALTAEIRDALQALPVDEQAEAFAEFHEAVAPLQEDIAAIRADLEALQADRQDAWLAYKAALLEGDVDAAAEALATLTAIKQDILDLQADLLVAKQALIDFLDEYLASLGTS